MSLAASTLYSPAPSAEPHFHWGHGVLVGVVIAAVAGLYYTPVHEAVGGIGLLILSFVAFFSPYAGIALLAGAIDLPDPSGLALTSVQIVSAGFIANYILSGRFVAVRLSRPVVASLGPFLPLAMLVGLSSLYHSTPQFFVLMIKILAFIAMVVLTWHSSPIDVRVAIAAGLLGFAAASSTYWLEASGLAAAQLIELYRLDLVRISARDPNATAIVLGTALCGLWLLIGFRPSKGGSRRRGVSVLAGILVLVFVLPALVFTGSRAALLGIPVGLVTGLSVAVRRLPGRAVLFSFVGLGVLVVVLDRLGPASVTDALGTLLAFTQAQGGGGVKIALWRRAVEVAAASPVFGVGSQEVFRNLNPYGTDVHNTYLEFAVIAGIPAFLASLAVVTAPLLMLMRAQRRGVTEAHAAVLAPASGVYAYCLFTTLFISAPGNKALWLSWILLTLTLLRIPTRGVGRVGPCFRSSPSLSAATRVGGTTS